MEECIHLVFFSLVEFFVPLHESDHPLEKYLLSGFIEFSCLESGNEL
ncbi:MAG TPA: hypothetical protein VMW92_04440 [Candidatus Heimdallarchaeota archaeon]|nr:hypothetical protein [Candidatus Heimdallarchaeota archaeon]